MKMIDQIMERATSVCYITIIILLLEKLDDENMTRPMIPCQYCDIVTVGLSAVGL